MTQRPGTRLNDPRRSGIDAMIEANMRRQRRRLGIFFVTCTIAALFVAGVVLWGFIELVQWITTK